MPLYEYECDACARRFEVIQKFSDGPVEVCAKCGKGPVKRLQSSPAIQFKGSGWYITDYARKGQSEKTGGSGGEKSDSSGKDAGKDAGAKTDTAAKSDSSSSTPAAPPAASSTSKE